MNTQKRVNERLQKIALKNQKVDLGLLQDIKAEMALANKGAMEAIDLANAAKRPAEKSLKLNEELLKKLDRTIASAKDLGADDAVSIMEKQKIQVKENIKAIDSVLSNLYKI